MATLPAPPPVVDESPASAAAIDLTKLTGIYIRIRDAKAEAKRQWEEKETEFNRQLELIEGQMLKHLNAHNMNTVNTDAGTFYRQEDFKPNIVDDSAFFQWIKENDAFDALQRRVGVGFIKQFAEAHEGALPPGIAASREYVIRVRKPK